MCAAQPFFQLWLCKTQILLKEALFIFEMSVKHNLISIIVIFVQFQVYPPVTGVFAVQ